jgi:hypothetical protein
MKLRYKDQIIVPFESFYRRASKGFCKGSIGGGRVDALNAMMI